MADINLPAVLDNTEPALKALTDALNVSREVLANEKQIHRAWASLPDVLGKIPPDLRTEGIVRMCVAVASGLFDSAVNYIWNASILELRSRVRRFGLSVVQQVVGGSDFDEEKLSDLKDAELLKYCLQLNLITEDGYFFLDHCRDIRNNFSVAHPTIGKLNEYELLSFLDRCATYALGSVSNPVGVDIEGFLRAIKGTQFTGDQITAWVERLTKTYEAQRNLLLSTLHGIFCDPRSTKESRGNALLVTAKFVSSLTPKIKSDLIDRHQEYLAKGERERHAASLLYFEKLGLVALLGESARHALISSACRMLMNIHQALDNWSTEPPFAERLSELVRQGAVPETAGEEFVETVTTCAVGDSNGASRDAYPYYHDMIQQFSSTHMARMLALPEARTMVGERIRSYPRCRAAFAELVALLDPHSVPINTSSVYNKWHKEFRESRLSSAISEFTEQALYEQAVWTIYDEDGHFLEFEFHGKLMIPFWSSRYRCDRWLSRRKDQPRTEKVTLLEFVDLLAQWKNHEDRVRIGVNWSNLRAGEYNVATEDLEARLRARIEKRKP